MANKYDYEDFLYRVTNSLENEMDTYPPVEVHGYYGSTSPSSIIKESGIDLFQTYIDWRQFLSVYEFIDNYRTPDLFGIMMYRFVFTRYLPYLCVYYAYTTFDEKKQFRGTVVNGEMASVSLGDVSLDDLGMIQPPERRSIMRSSNTTKTMVKDQPQGEVIVMARESKTLCVYGPLFACMAD